MSTLDPRIGQLMRKGQIVHYAFVNGYSKPEFVGTLEEVEIALGIRKAQKPKAKMDLKPYTVHIEKKSPAWDEVGGFDWNTDAVDANDAIKKARQFMWNEGFSGRMEGTITYRARRATN